MRLSPGNPMGRVLLALLIFEAVVIGLAVPGMVVVDGGPLQTAGLAAGGVALIALVAAGTLRRAVGYPLGWLAQALGMALGVLTSWMVVMGGLFALLWAVAFVLGRRLEAPS